MRGKNRADNMKTDENNYNTDFPFFQYFFLQSVKMEKSNHF